MEIIKRIKRFLSSRLYLKIFMLENPDLLKNGTYKFDPSLNYVYLLDRNDEKDIHKMFSTNFDILMTRFGKIKILLYRVVNRIVFRSIIIKSNAKEFYGSALIIGNSQKDIKLFDFTNQKILLFFDDIKKFEKEITNYDYFKEYFDVPKIVHKDLDKKILIEELFEQKIYRMVN